jgi:hypothetical protein
MKQRHPIVFCSVLLASVCLSGCGLIGGAIKAGFWMALILLLIVIAIIGLLLRRTGDEPAASPRTE